MARKLVAYFLGEDPVERRFLITVNVLSAAAVLVAYAR